MSKGSRIRKERKEAEWRSAFDDAGARIAYLRDVLRMREHDPWRLQAQEDRAWLARTHKTGKVEWLEL